MHTCVIDGLEAASQVDGRCVAIWMGSQPDNFQEIG